jgi:single-strand DNA-binding protein
MSLSLNKVTLAGNLTRDPEVEFLANYRAVANFGLAVNEKYKDKDGNKKESVTFIDCEAWGRTAELIGQYLSKGNPCYVEGKLKLDTWDDKDGQKKSKLKIVVDVVQFLGGKRDESRDESERTPTESPEPKPQRPAPTPAGEDEPPF